MDPLTAWNVVITAEALADAGVTAEELVGAVHPSLVGNTQGSGMGGMSSISKVFMGPLSGRQYANDVLQEALGNVVAAHVNQGLIGGYGPMVHPVAACATAAVSLEEAVDKITLGQGRDHHRRRLGRPHHRGDHGVRQHGGHRRQRDPDRVRAGTAPAQPAGGPAPARVRGVPGRWQLRDLPRIGRPVDGPAGSGGGRVCGVLRRRHPHVDPGSRARRPGFGARWRRTRPWVGPWPTSASLLTMWRWSPSTTRPRRPTTRTRRSCTRRSRRAWAAPPAHRCGSSRRSR